MVKIGLLGCGTIGSGVVELIEKNTFKERQILIERILVRNLAKHCDSSYKIKLTNRFEDILNSDIDIVVEVMGGIDPAYFYVKQSLLKGRHVVTANKDLIARYGTELQKIAREKGVRLLFEASVGGGIPIIKPLTECLAANNITEISGIMNGTTNYILSQMSGGGKSFKEALNRAQRNGYAEANPEADVDGYDAGRKLAILSSLAFHHDIDYEDIHIEGIRDISVDDIQLARYMGYSIKLLAVSRKTDDGIMARVAPVMIKNSHPLAQVGDVYNAIVVKGDAVGDVLFYGRGAGKLPTASAVLGDVIDIVKNSIGSCKACRFPIKDLPNISPDIRDSECRFFVRVRPADRAGAMEEIARALDGFEFIFPERAKLDRPIEDNQIIFVTSKIKEREFEDRVNGIKLSGKIDKVLSIIRLEGDD